MQEKYLLWKFCAVHKTTNPCKCSNAMKINCVLYLKVKYCLWPVCIRDSMSYCLWEAVVVMIVLVVGFTTTCTISVYHHYSCEFESHSMRGVLDTTLYLWYLIVYLKDRFPIKTVVCMKQGDVNLIIITYSFCQNILQNSLGK